MSTHHDADAQKLKHCLGRLLAAGEVDDDGPLGGGADPDPRAPGVRAAGGAAAHGRAGRSPGVAAAAATRANARARGPR